MIKPKPVHTPGMEYFVRQSFPDLFWHVVSIDTLQARSMRERGTQYVYKTSAQAHIVADKLNKKRKESLNDKPEEPEPS